jgi:MYXO-CTERM domain-containing protein
VTANAAGSLASTLTLALQSNANNVAGLSNANLADKTVTVTGAGFDYAKAAVTGKTLAFGNLHVGAVGSTDTLAVANETITAAAYQDNLNASATAVAGVSASSIAELAAGGSANLTFTANTGVARSLAGNVSLTLTSTGTLSGLDSKSLTSAATVTTSGQVYSGLSTWNTNGNGSWGTFASGFGANWGANQGSAGLDAGFANVDTATFDNTALTAGSSATVSLDGAAPSLKAITFNTTGGGYTLAAGTGGALTFASDTGTASLTATAGAHTVSVDAALASNLAVSVAAGSLSVTGVVSGTGSLTKSGNGLLTLAGANTFSGGATVTAGKLTLGAASALGTAAATVTGGELDLGGFTVANAVTLTAGTLSHGAISNSALSVAAGTVSANLAGSTTVTKTGAGTATLAVANTYTGATAVQGGTLVLGNAAALGTSTVTIATGATLDLANYDLTGATLVLNGGAIANATAYTGSVGFAAGITSFGAADLTSLDANVAVRVAAGQTLDTASLTRAIDFRGGSLANLGTFAGTLNVKGGLDASATGLSAGAINLASTGSIALGNTASAKTINYQGGALSGANYTGDLAFTGAVTMAGVVTAGNFTLNSGDTLTVAVNGSSANIKLLGGTVDFGGRTSTSSVAYTSGVIANGSGFTGDVSYSGALTLAQGAFGAGRILVGSTNTANFGAGFANRVSYAGGTILNGANYAGTLTVTSGATLDAATNLAGSIVLTNGTQLTGTGSVGAVTAKGGSQISTGASTPGLLTTAGLALEAGSTLKVNLKDATAARGVGFDSVAVTGLLDLSGLSSSNRVTLQLKSLDANGLTGNLAVQNFSWNDPKNFTLFTYGQLSLGTGVSISDVFSIDYSGFQDAHGVAARADWFTISNDTGAGAIVLTAIPEPSTYGLAIGALALAAAALRRRRKVKAAEASAQ